MTLFYHVTDKKSLEIRNKIFTQDGIPALYKNGFEKSPFSTAWFGKADFGGFSYQLCKLDSNYNFIIINTYILKGENWIQIFLNIFAAKPVLESLKQLNAINGLGYGIPPGSRTNMRLRIGDRKGPPILHIFEKQHKLESYYTKPGFNESVKNLSELIKADMNNIDYFILRWYDMFEQPLKTTWEGMPL